MNELIPINTTADKMTVNGRDLHMFLGVDTPYNKWFPRMCEYGFTDNVDFWTKMSESTGGRPGTYHQLTIDMAKEIAMLQRNEKGKMARQYFIQVEKEWNSPEKVMARALVMANEKIATLEIANKEQRNEIAKKDQLIGEMKPKMDYMDTLLANKKLMPITFIAKDYGMSPKGFNKMLKDMGVQYKIGERWVLYSKYQACGYTSTQYYQDKFHRDGSPVTNMEWTQKGRLFLYGFLKKRNVLPMIEREDV